MPTYLYKCPDCGCTDERQHKMTESPKVLCLKCLRMMGKVIQPAGVIFKGSGFYSTDYRKAGR